MLEEIGSLFGLGTGGSSSKIFLSGGVAAKILVITRSKQIGKLCT